MQRGFNSGAARTFGLTHLALAVRDVSRSVDFYHQLFGTQVMYQESDWAQITTPGSNDILVFELKPRLAGKSGGGVLHFGFRLKEPREIQKIRQTLDQMKVPIVKEGEFVPGEPFIFFKDPDGYEVEVWFEKYTHEE